MTSDPRCWPADCVVPDDLHEHDLSGETAGHFLVSTSLAVLHRSDGLLVVEIEPGVEPLTLNNTYRPTRTAVCRFHRAIEPADLCRIAVEEVRNLTGFDRVMVYRFDEAFLEGNAHAASRHVARRVPARLSPRKSLRPVAPGRPVTATRALSAAC